MSRRFLLASTAIATLCMLAGLLVLDIPIVHWIHGSTIENAPMFVLGLDALDGVFGIHVSYWLAPGVMIGSGAIFLLLARSKSQRQEFALAILGAGLVQAATISLMMLGKGAFGRLRPLQWIETGELTSIWFVGGGSFPSGHSSFYFGLFLPLAAAAPRAWQRAVLLAFPLFAISARLDMGKHFLSDVSASALIAACMALLVSRALRHCQPGNRIARPVVGSDYRS